MSSVVETRALPGARNRLIAAALVLAVTTGVVALGLGATPNHAWGALGYVAVVGFAVRAPGAIWAQVLAGQLLAGSLLLGSGELSWWVLAPVIASVIATAEVLGVVARLNSVVPRDPTEDLRRAGRATLLGGVTFAAVALAGGLPGPRGLLAVSLASAACVAVAAVLLERPARPSGGSAPSGS